jgi:hypothetical protein
LIKYRRAHGGIEAELTVTERARLNELERENQELRAQASSNRLPGVAQISGRPNFSRKVKVVLVESAPHS